MSVGPKTTAAHMVWGERGTGNVNHPLTPTMAAPQYKAARVALELFQRQGTLEVQAFVETSDDGKAFSNRQTLGSVLSANGTTITSGGSNGFIDLSGSPYNLAGKRYVRFGVQASNSSGSDLNTGYAVLRVEGRDF